MIDVKIKRNFNLNRIKCDFSKELNEGIDVIALDIQRGIDKQSQFGKPLPRNEESTLRRKRAKGWGEKSLIAEKKWMRDSGKMIKTKARQNRQVATLIPKEERVDVAYWLQEEGVKTKHGIKHYNFWGISKKAEQEIMLRVKARIHQELRSA